MLFYPQLATGTLACYPVTRTMARRTALNRMEDGSGWKVADPDASEIRWELKYSGLSDAERIALESFFVECEGRLRSFTFLDPAGNLLAYSDDLAKNVWRVDGLLRRDEAALTNTGQVWQGVSQTVSGPEQFTWCFSATAQGSGSLKVSIGSLESQYVLAAEPQIVWCSGSAEGDAEEITVRLDLAPGATARVERLSVQAQPMPGEYRRTTESSGVFASTRFEDDRLVFTADGPDDHSTTVRLRSRG